MSHAQKEHYEHLRDLATGAFKLVNCPWCKSEPESGEVMGTLPGGKRYYQTGCQKCDACGPSAPTIKEADEKWNQLGKL